MSNADHFHVLYSHRFISVHPHLQTRAEMGHDVRIQTDFKRSVFGRGQIIQKIVDGSGRTVWAAGSDLRADGHAAAQI